jgi:hypothetical protein
MQQAAEAAASERQSAHLQVHDGRLHCSKGLLEELEAEGLAGDVKGVPAAGSSVARLSFEGGCSSEPLPSCL